MKQEFTQCASERLSVSKTHNRLSIGLECKSQEQQSLDLKEEPFDGVHDSLTEI